MELVNIPSRKSVYQYLHDHQSELIELHRSLVRIPTVNRGDGSCADESKLARVAADFLKIHGIESEIVEGIPGRGNLLAQTGSADGFSILWMSHGDVVTPGDENAWSHPPFSADLADGRIWGRGANDCKMLAACQLYAMATLAQLNLPGKGRLRLAIGADEEVGGQLGFGFLARERPDFLLNDLAICEGGGDTLGRFKDNVPVVSLGTGEKGRMM